LPDVVPPDPMLLSGGNGNYKHPQTTKSDLDLAATAFQLSQKRRRERKNLRGGPMKEEADVGEEGPIVWPAEGNFALFGTTVVPPP